MKYFLPFLLLCTAPAVWGQTIKAHALLSFELEANDVDGNLKTHTLDVNVNSTGWVTIYSPQTLGGVVFSNFTGQGQSLNGGAWQSADVATTFAPDGSTVTAGTAALGAWGSKRTVSFISGVVGSVVLRSTGVDADGLTTTKTTTLTLEKGDQSKPTLSGPASIVYGDGATLVPSGGESSAGYFYTLTGMPSGSMSGDVYTPVSVGTETVSVVKLTDGTYLESPSSDPLNLEVLQRPVTLAVAPGTFSKVYDGTVSCPSGVLSLAKVGTDDVSPSAGSFQFASADAGTVEILFTGFSLTGADAFKYALTGQPTGTGTILNADPVPSFTNKTLLAGSALGSALDASWRGVDGAVLPSGPSYAVGGTPVTSATVMNAGEYTVVAHRNASQNYNASDVSAVFKFSPTTLTVNTGGIGAFRLDGGSWGTAPVEVTAGRKTVEFQAVHGYKTPASTDVTIASLDPVTLTATYTGVPVIEADNAIDFGTVDQIATATKTVTVNNTGHAALNLTVSTSGDFSVLPDVGTIPAGSSFDFTVKFTPSTLGAKSADLTFTTNDETNPSFVVSLSGTVGGTGKLSAVIGGTAITSGQAPTRGRGDLWWVEMGKGATLPVTLKNIGSAELPVSFSVSGDFTGNLDATTLAANDTKDVSLNFSADGVRSVSQTVQIGDFNLNVHAKTFLPVSDDLKGQNVMSAAKPKIAVRILNENSHTKAVGPMKIPKVEVVGPFTVTAKVIDYETETELSNGVQDIVVNRGEALVVTVTQIGAGEGMLVIAPENEPAINVPLYGN